MNTTLPISVDELLRQVEAAPRCCQRRRPTPVLRPLSNRAVGISMLAVVVLHGIALGVLSQGRSIDGDEGYYASAAGLVAQGASVYRDFFYPQMPLMPYFYSLAYDVHGSLASLRYLSVILSVATVFLWCLYLRKEYSGAPAVGLVALLLLALNPGFGSWGVVVKTYALSNCLVTGVLLALYAGLRSGRRAWFAMGGLFCGLLVSVRLLYVAVPLVILVWLLTKDFRAGRRPAVSVGFFVGAMVGVLPAVWFFFLNPDGFIFNNFEYHSLRSDSPSLTGHVLYLARFFLKMMLARSYLALIFVLGLVGLLFSGRARDLSGFHGLCAWTAVAFMLGSAVPYPLYFQYFTAATAPLLVPLAAAGLSVIERRRAALCWVVLCFAIAVCFMEVFNETYGDEGGGVWDLGAYGEISRYIRANTEPEDVVLSFWPGYVFESDRKCFTGLENHFGLRVSSGLSVEEHRRYRIARVEDIIESVSRQRPRIVIVGAWMNDFYRHLSERETAAFFAVLEDNYCLAKKVNEVLIYSPCGDEPRAVGQGA
ncbi:MAG: hypothetical protein GY856_16590 [bacterium]|nr:hypothetical protein [bacterium]